MWDSKPVTIIIIIIRYADAISVWLYVILVTSHALSIHNPCCTCCSLEIDASGSITTFVQANWNTDSVPGAGPCWDCLVSRSFSYNIAGSSHQFSGELVQNNMEKSTKQMKMLLLLIELNMKSRATYLFTQLLT